MAPSPENDNAPKAPDKTEKSGKADRESTQKNTACAAENKHACVSKLNEGEFRALLDEAINYKNPKDREGKSDIFVNLLLEAEEEERNVRAERAVGSKLVRYCNPSAKKRQSRHKRQPSSVSENLTHGGSLNNLAKEELYETASYLQRPRKTVSARQRAGGSLPCNVNVGVPPASYDKQFFEEVRRKQTQTSKREYTAIDMESESLLEHDSLSREEEFAEQNEIEMEQRIPRVPLKYTTSATLQVGNVDDGVTMSALENADKTVENISCQPVDHFQVRMLPSPYNLAIPGQHFFNARSVEDKKVDENGNALAHGTTDIKKSKKKKSQPGEKNVIVKEAKDLDGHRGDIIDDVEKLNEYICGAKPKSNNVHKSKLQKHMNDEKTGKKQRTRSKGKGANASGLQKSNSMDEMTSTAKLEDLVTVAAAIQDSEKVPLRPTKSNNLERPRERRSWGNTELQVYTNISAENLETAEFRVVTKKKKSKKRRNSISSGHRQPRDPYAEDFNRVPSPEIRRKSACSVPHSEKSNDSSDVDSVHSLPIDTQRRNRNVTDLDGDINVPVSYADIAKNSNSLDRPKAGRAPNEKKEKAQEEKFEEKEKQDVVSEKIVKIKPTNTQGVQTSPKLQHATHYEKSLPVQTAAVHNNPPAVRNSPPDVHNFQNFPSIRDTNSNSNKHQVDNRLVSGKSATQNSVPKIYKNSQNNFIKNMKNASNTVVVDVGRSAGVSIGKLHLVQGSAPKKDNQLYLQGIQGTIQPMPANIPDVQTIEKIHFAQMNSVPVASDPPLPRFSSVPVPQPEPVASDASSAPGSSKADCDPAVSVRTRNEDERPVVIMSGDQNEVPGLVFGFDVNETLLNSGEANSIVDDIIARFRPPEEDADTELYNHEKMVYFISQSFEEALRTGTWYSEELDNNYSSQSAASQQKK